MWSTRLSSWRVANRWARQGCGKVRVKDVVRYASFVEDGGGVAERGRDFSEGRSDR